MLRHEILVCVKRESFLFTGKCIYNVYVIIYVAVNYFHVKCNFNTSSLSSPDDFPVLFNFFFQVFHTLQAEGR